MSSSFVLHCLTLLWLMGGASAIAQTSAGPPKTVAEQITLELTRPNDDPVGRPLPVAAHWNTGFPSSGHAGWDPEFMMDYLDADEFVIPGFYLQMPIRDPEPWSYYEAGLRRARDAGVPIYIRFTQWDRPFLDDPRYFDLPPADNPNVIDVTDGHTILPLTDPQGPVERWQEVGAEWGGLQTVLNMQAEYPDPPRVFWLNNFEHPRLLWGDVDTSWRFAQSHGTGKSDDEKRGILGDGWIERDAALFQSLCRQLTPAWQAASTAVCYTAFGRRKYGLWNGWDRKSLHVPGRFSPWPLAVNGSPSYYVFGDNDAHKETDYRVDGPQIAGMNWPFMLEEALRDAPDYFWEVSLSDGGLERHDWYRAQGQTYDVARYRGYWRFALWSQRPRILREFRLSHSDRFPYIEYWEAGLETVKEIHTTPRLQRFWRKGVLVLDPTNPHPYQKNLYAGYTDAEVDRSFQLPVDVNPARPWTGATELKVFALALRLGQEPRRRWLLYAYAPLEDQLGVTITIPDFGDVTLDVHRGDGSFVFLRE